MPIVKEDPLSIRTDRRSLCGTGLMSAYLAGSDSSILET